MSYATLDDLYLAFKENNVKQLLEDKGDTSPLVSALGNASSEIDGYLSRRYKVPLKIVPKIVTEWTCVIAYYKRSLEYGVGLSEERYKRYEAVFRYLREIAKGDANLPELENEDGEELAPEGRDGGIMLGANNAKREFSRKKLDGL